MTIINTVTKSTIDHSTRTEVDIQSNNVVVFSRIIGSKMCTIKRESEEPITIGFVGNLTKMDDDFFQLMAKNQQED